MKKINVQKKWYAESVRGYCVRYGRYTCGNNNDYEKMLNFVKTHKPTTNNIYKVACNIADHSNLNSYGQTRTENIQSIMYDITKDCIHTFYEIQE